MKLRPREMFLVNVYMVIVVCILLYFFFFQFGYPKHTSINARIGVLENSLEKINGILNSKDMVEKQYAAFEKKLSVKQTPGTADTEILQDIRGKAVRAGLNVINIKPLSLKEDDDLYGAFDFKLETEGELKNLGRFLYDLDNSPYIFSIKFTQINAQTQGEPLKVQLLLSAALARG